MRNRHVVVAWLLWAAFAAVLFLSIYQGVSDGSGEPVTAFDILWATSIIGFPTTGAIIATRQPRSPLGWMFLIAPLLVMTGVGTGERAETLALDHDLDAAGRWGWASNVSISGGASLVGLIALLIPNGKLPSPRWRTVAGLETLIVVVWIATAMFRPGALASVESVEVVNPYGVQGLSGLFNALQALLAPVFTVLFLLSLASIPLRLRRASSEERQQLKWVAYGSGVVVLCVLVLSVLQTSGVGSQVVVTLITTLAMSAMPVAIGIAMLRYRLYDIDVVINRTLVYGGLTAVLAGIYIALVFGLQTLLEPLMAESDLAVAASTLAVAGIARPARNRLQRFIDHRFYRRKFDAQRTLETFTGELRDEVDLSELSSRLTSVVAGTMQPAHVSLWLRKERA